MCLLQVWTRFDIFGEIHFFSFPKNLRKIRQPLDASKDHLTKDQLQKNFPHAKIISSNSWCALFLLVSEFSVQLQSAVSFSSEHGVDLASNCSGALLPVPPPCPVRCMILYSRLLS